MTTRVLVALTVLACGCGLVSGLDSLSVDGGAASDASTQDVTEKSETSDDDGAADTSSDRRRDLGCRRKHAVGLCVERRGRLHDGELDRSRSRAARSRSRSG